MDAKVEVLGETVLVTLPDEALKERALKDERIFYSRIIVGQADGTLIAIGAGGAHVHPGTGPLAAAIAEGVRAAVADIRRGVNTLASNAGALSEV